MAPEGVLGWVLGVSSVTARPRGAPRVLSLSPRVAPCPPRGGPCPVLLLTVVTGVALSPLPSGCPHYPRLVTGGQPQSQCPTPATWGVSLCPPGHP